MRQIFDTNALFKEVLRPKPPKFDEFPKQLQSSKDSTQIYLIGLLKKIPDDQKESFMQDVYDSWMGNLEKTWHDAFSNKKAEPLMKLIYERATEIAKEAEERAKEEVLRRETLVQREAKGKMLEYTKEIGILNYKLDEKNNFIDFMEENREKLKQN